MQKIFQERVGSSRRTEYNRLKEEREERIDQILESRKQDREYKRKMIYFLRTEDDRQKRLRVEEEARKLEEMERQKKEEAERKARLDEIAEKQRQREKELEEKERKWKEEVLGRTPIVPSRAAEPVEAIASALPAAAAAASTGKYVPRFKRAAAEVAPSAGPSSATDRWSGGGGNRIDDRGGDRWRGDERRPPPGAGEVHYLVILEVNVEFVI